jgi:hypothetical protein
MDGVMGQKVPLTTDNEVYMSENITMSQKDVAQIEKYEHDDDLCAKRVIIVGGDKLDIAIDSDKIANSVANAVSHSLAVSKQQEVVACNCQPEIKVIEVKVPFSVPSEPQIITIKEPQIVLQHQVERIDFPVIVKEYEVINVPVIVKEVEPCNCSVIAPKSDSFLKILVLIEAAIILALALIK